MVCVFSVVFGVFAASWRAQKLQGMAKRNFKIQTELLTRNNKQWVIVGENWIKVKLSQVSLVLGQYQPALDLLMSLKSSLRNLKCCFFSVLKQEMYLCIFKQGVFCLGALF